MTIDELIERSHNMAVEKGWWPDGPGKRPVAELVNNFHAEISEAWEEWRAERLETWYRSESEKFSTDWAEKLLDEDPGKWTSLLKPEGFWVEIADLVIRLADTMGAMGWQYRDLRPSDYAKLEQMDWDLPRLVSTLHICVGCLGIGDGGDIGNGWEAGCQRSAGGAIHLCLLAAAYHGVDLLEICELKMAYNATRP